MKREKWVPALLVIVSMSPPGLSLGMVESLQSASVSPGKIIVTPRLMLPAACAVDAVYLPFRASDPAPRERLPARPTSSERAV